MANQVQWFVRKGEKTHGPFTSQQLRQLAETSRIAPSTDVRNGISEQWVPAQRIKGLFTTNNPKAKPNSNAQSSAGQAVPVAPRVAHQPEPVGKPTRVACSFCGEEIAANAVKCRHCNEFLDGRQQVQPAATTTTVVIHQEPKSVAVALLLTFFFGPFGMFYSTQVGALVMIGVWFIIGVLSLLFVGLLLIPFAWIAQMVWAAMACDEEQKKRYALLR